MEFYQWLVPLLAIYYSVKIVRQYFNKKRLLRSTLIWLTFWVVISIFSLTPHELSTELANLLGFKNNIHAVIFIGLGLLFIFNMFFTSTIERLEKQMTEVVRKLAIENQELRHKLSDYEMKMIDEHSKSGNSEKSISNE